MFKVECPGCKAPYQVDERRIPSSGLKMRCPKCGTSFKVDPPSESRHSSPVLGGVLGMTAEGESAPPPALSGPAPKPSVNLRGTIVGVAPGAAQTSGRPSAANFKGTMMGVAPGAFGVAPPPAQALKPQPSPPGNPPPMPPRRGGEARPPPPSELDSFFDDADLPAPLAPPPMPRRAPLAADRNSPGQPAFDDLPAMPAPQRFNDLPAMPAPPRFDDLPATPPSQPFNDLPVAVGARPVAPFSLDLAFDRDLPTALGSGAPGAGLPTLSSPTPGKSEIGLPSSPLRSGAGGAGLPRVAGRESGEVGLPSVPAGLPELSRSTLPARRGVELPSLGGQSVQSGGAFELDDGLPLIGANFPAPGGVGLPERSQAGLPSLGGSLPVLSALGLPTPSASGLPTTGGAGLPSPFPAKDELDLERMPSLPPDFGLDPVQPSTSRRAHADFGDIELPIGSPPSAPPAFGGKSAYQGDAEEADLFGEAALPPGRTSPPRPAAAPDAIVRQGGGGTAYGEVNLGDEGGEAQVPIDESAPGGASPRDEDMEFGAIPQEDRARPSADAGRGSTHVVMPAARGSKESLKPKRKLNLRLYGALFVACVAGASLALVPSVGPFGAYVVIDHLKADEYASLVESAVAIARKEMASDTYPEAKRAIEKVDAARASAKRVRALPAYAAFTAYAEELRFGADPAIHARASVLLDELVDHAETPYLSLARCARAAAEGQIARAKQLFDGLPVARSGDPDPAFLHGEIALRAGDAKAAIALWRVAAIAQNSARSAFGLARASYAAGDTAGARVAAEDALSKNPSHVGARILLARISSATRSGELDALRLLGSIAKDPSHASPDEIVSAQTLLGDIHLARSRMSQAEAAYGEALKINPKAARALNGLGDALYRAGRFSEAQARFEASTQADPDDLSAKIGIAKTKLALERLEDARTTLKKLYDTYPQSLPVAYWYGRALEAAGSRAAAETVYRSALKAPGSDPQAVDLYIALALLQSQQGNNDDAQKTLAEAKSRMPDLPAIHKALGDVALSQGRYAEATSELRQAVSLDGEDLGAKFRLGVALRRDAKFDEAGKLFDEVTTVDKDYPGLALERGLLYEASGRTDEALKEYEGALAKAPKDPDLMLRVGCGKVSAGRAKQAEELLRKVLTERPNSAETNHCLGRALLIEGTRLAEALRLLERAVELDANRAEYQLYAGWAANEAGNVPKAEHYLAEALRLDQGLADGYWQRGVLRQRQGAARDAIADLSKALELRPSRHEAHAALADAYYDLGKEPHALSEWQLAIQAEPDNATWRFRYGKLLFANHQVDGSREQINKALELSANEDPAPRWSWEAHNLLAHAIGLKPEAVKHWEEFLKLGPRDSPYRAEAKASLEKLGHPWTGD